MYNPSLTTGGFAYKNYRLIKSCRFFFYGHWLAESGARTRLVTTTTATADGRGPFCGLPPVLLWANHVKQLGGQEHQHRRAIVRKRAAHSLRTRVFVCICCTHCIPNACIACRHTESECVYVSVAQKWPLFGHKRHAPGSLHAFNASEHYGIASLYRRPRNSGAYVRVFLWTKRLVVVGEHIPLGSISGLYTLLYTRTLGIYIFHCVYITCVRVWSDFVQLTWALVWCRAYNTRMFWKRKRTHSFWVIFGTVSACERHYFSPTRLVWPGCPLEKWVGELGNHNTDEATQVTEPPANTRDYWP